MTYWRVTWIYEEGGRQEPTSALHRGGGRTWQMSFRRRKIYRGSTHVDGIPLKRRVGSPAAKAGPHLHTPNHGRPLMDVESTQQTGSEEQTPPSPIPVFKLLFQTHKEIWGHHSLVTVKRQDLSGNGGAGAKLEYLQTGTLRNKQWWVRLLHL